MEDNLSLNPNQIQVIEGFKKELQNSDKFRLGNEDKIYLYYFIDSLVSENYGGATHVGYVFLEKYLRGVLLFHKWSITDKKEEYLYFLDREEKILEDGDDGINNILLAQSKIISKIRKFSFRDGEDKNEILKALKNYLQLVLDEKKELKNQLHFNDITRELQDYGLLSAKERRDLNKQCAKYRNTLQHGLLKRLSSQMLVNKTMSVVAGGDGGIRALEVDTSNLIMREIGIVEDLLKAISLDLFNIIHGIIIKFGIRK